MLFSCDILYNAILTHALRQPRLSKPLQDFVKDECRELLLEYGDDNPLVRKHREDCIKWENAFKASQVQLFVEFLNRKNFFKCILLQYTFNVQEELRTTRENHAIEIRALNERLVLQMKDAKDEVNALQKNYMSSSGKM